MDGSQSGPYDGSQGTMMAVRAIGWQSGPYDGSQGHRMAVRAL